MKVLLGGVRGSSVVAGDEFARFGRDTTCLLVSGEAGERILLDAGSGAFSAGRSLTKSPGDRSLLALFTHLHLDHLIGLPSLPQLYDPRWKIRLAAPGGWDPERALTTLLSPPFWPLTPAEMGGGIEFLELPRDPFEQGAITITHCPVHHPGGGTAYRLDESPGGGSLVLTTDMEWGLSSEDERAELVRLCSDPTPADLLICDGQFDRDSYTAHRGWGHSCWEDGVELAGLAGVGRLLLTHHDPSATDGMLSAREKEILEGGGNVTLARQGDLIEL